MTYNYIVPEHSKKIKIIIAAEPLENGTGLAMFLLDSVALFAVARPDWQFTLLALSAFSEARVLEKHPNVSVIFCDRQSWRGAISKAFPKMPGREMIFNLMAERLPTKASRKLFGNLTEIWESLGRYDAVWIPHFAVNRNRWPALYKKGTIKAPVLLSIFDLHPAVFPEEYTQAPEILLDYWNTFKSFAQQSSAIVTYSQFQKNAIVKHFGIDPNRIEVVYMPLPNENELSHPCETKEVSVANHRLGVREPYVFCPMSQGAIHKNHLSLIRAWAIVYKELGEECPQLIFTSKGSPAQYRIFAELIEKLNLDKKVVFTGPIKRSQIAMLYHNCVAVISPTLYESGCGLPILEALSLGKNIAGSDIPPVREQMEHFNTHINYFDPRDEKDMAKVIIKMIQKPAAIRSKALAQIKKVKQSSRQQFVAAYLRKLEGVALLSGTGGFGKC